MKFSSTDYKAGELFCHAQSCIWLLGRSDLGDLLLNNKDPHSDFAAGVRHIDYDEFVRRKKEPALKDSRQAAKPIIFGKMGGAGAVTICLQQRKQGPDTPCEAGPSWIMVDEVRMRGYKGTRFCILMNGSKTCGAQKATVWGKNERKIPPTCVECLECCELLSKAWTDQWWENRRYFNYMSTQIEQGYLITPEMIKRWPWWGRIFRPGTRLAPGEIAHHHSGMIRGGCEFTSGCNTLFQNLLAQITLSAYWRVTRECHDRAVIVPAFAHENSRRSAYGGGESPLYGSKAPGFLHDEILAEHPDAVFHDAATRVGEIMVEEAAYYLPDMAPAVEAEPCVFDRWDKNAATVRDSAGRLQVWHRK